MMTLNLSLHAEQRRTEMGVTDDQIVATLCDPELTYPGRKERDTTFYKRGDVLLAVNNETLQVITVLWHGKDGR
jgi:hypothetical protein